MKKYMLRLFFLVCLVAGFSLAGSSQIIVRVRPAAPVVVRTVAPSPRHIWIEGNWVVRHNRYVRVNGYWTVPRRGYNWANGYWAHRRGGYVWVPGHWVKVKRGRW